ncbi:uncharacterized protein [Lolium perenne]|uniref:uncharacterized protein n=1 Tax=Lolium perenne TaxID=4522 RepID=UPI0021F61F5C|nr:uncharacterized protein LOC127292608 [Lolium perenne]XP_051179019.1 uncharacterized protein LOC127293434 [Lolium perenne]
MRECKRLIADLAGVGDALARPRPRPFIQEHHARSVEWRPVGEAERAARELLDAGAGRPAGGGARLCSMEAPPPLLLVLEAPPPLVLERSRMESVRLQLRRGARRGQSSGAGRGRRDQD